MTILGIIALAIYLVVFVIFLVAVYAEAPRQGAEVGVIHYIVALVWPGWAIWYAGVWISERFRKR